MSQNNTKSLKNIRTQPEFIEGIGDIYPIKIKDYDEFQECSGVLYISKNNFKNCDDIPLLDLIFICAEQLGFKPNELITIFEKLFSLVLQKEVQFKSDGKSSWFGIEDQYKIDFSNYEKIRSVIMNQNIMIEPKIYKTEIMNKWAQKALKAKQKNAPNITIEDMLSTVSVVCHKHYCDLENYSIYQLYSDFYRVRKIINHNSSIQYKCSQNIDPSSISVEDFAESLDLYHNPYDDLFVDKNKFSKLNNAVK